MTGTIDQALPWWTLPRETYTSRTNGPDPSVTHVRRPAPKSWEAVTWRRTVWLRTWNWFTRKTDNDAYDPTLLPEDACVTAWAESALHDNVDACADWTWVDVLMFALVRWADDVPRQRAALAWVWQWMERLTAAEEGGPTVEREGEGAPPLAWMTPADTLSHAVTHAVRDGLSQWGLTAKRPVASVHRQQRALCHVRPLRQWSQLAATHAHVHSRAHAQRVLHAVRS